VLPWRCKGEGDSNPMAILDMFNKTTAMIGLDVTSETSKIMEIQ